MTSPRRAISDRSGCLSESWKDRENYTDGLAGTSFHNSWRAIRFTSKGQRIGCETKWRKFSGFKDDMYATYTEGLRLSRINKKMPFSRENCVWAHPDTLCEHRLSMLEYNGEIKNIREWCIQYNLNYSGVQQRRMRGKRYTPYEILFGKKRKKREPIEERPEGDALRKKALRLIARYKIEDTKRNFHPYELDAAWLLENILNRQCSYCNSTKIIGADRVDNDKGHCRDNIIPACYRCNRMRSNIFTYPQMLKIGRFLQENIDNE